MTDPIEPTSGNWRVKTENSTYYIDLDEHTGIRIPDDVTTGSVLRRDGQLHYVHKIGPLEVGKPLDMLITVEDGVTTMRTTSWVTGYVGVLLHATDSKVFLEGSGTEEDIKRLLEDFGDRSD